MSTQRRKELPRRLLSRVRVDGTIESEKFPCDWTVADSVSLEVRFKNLFDETHVKKHLSALANSLTNDASMISELLNGELTVSWPV